MSTTRLFPSATPGKPYGSFTRTHVATSTVWVGGAPLVAQATTWIFEGWWEASDHVYIEIGSKRYGISVGSATIATILTNLSTAISAIDANEWPEFTATTPTTTSTTLTLTANTAGKPFTINLITDSTTGTIDGANHSTGSLAIPNSGPNDWGSRANWSANAVPGTGDTVTVDLDGVEIWWGLEQSGVTLVELNLLFRSGTLGLPETNTDGTAYAEPNPTYLQIGATIVNIDSEQSGRIKVALGAVQGTVNVLNSGTGVEQGIEAVLLTGTHASNAVNVNGGEVGIAVQGGETATAALRQNGGTVRTGVGCSLTTILKTGGTLTTAGGVSTSLTHSGGTATIGGNSSATIAQLTINGGVVVLNTTGLISGNTTISGSGFLDFSKDMRVKPAPTNPILLYGAQARGSDANGVITKPYTVSFPLGLGVANWQFGPNFKVEVTAA